MRGEVEILQEAGGGLTISKAGVSQHTREVVLVAWHTHHLYGSKALGHKAGERSAHVLTFPLAEARLGMKG